MRWLKHPPSFKIFVNVRKAVSEAHKCRSGISLEARCHGCMKSAVWSADGQRLRQQPRAQHSANSRRRRSLDPVTTVRGGNERFPV